MFSFYKILEALEALWTRKLIRKPDSADSGLPDQPRLVKRRKERLTQLRRDAQFYRSRAQAKEGR